MVYAEIAGLVAAAAALYILFPSLLKILLRRRFRRRAGAAGKVFLTFDDGPAGGATERILDILAARGARATFFVLGERIAGQGVLLERMAAEGHEIGDHGYGHLHPWKTDPFRYGLDLIRGARAWREVPDASRAPWHRPPFGKFNLLTVAYLAARGGKAAFWSVDPRDYRGEAGDTVARRVLDAIAPGAVVLFHDGRRKEGDDAANTAAALEIVLDELDKRGLEAAPLREIESP